MQTDRDGDDVASSEAWQLLPVLGIFWEPGLEQCPFSSHGIWLPQRWSWEKGVHGQTETWQPCFLRFWIQRNFQVSKGIYITCECHILFEAGREPQPATFSSWNRHIPPKETWRYLKLLLLPAHCREHTRIPMDTWHIISWHVISCFTCRAPSHHELLHATSPHLIKFQIRVHDSMT